MVCWAKLRVLKGWSAGMRLIGEEQHSHRVVFTLIHEEGRQKQKCRTTCVHLWEARKQAVLGLFLFESMETFGSAFCLVKVWDCLMLSCSKFSQAQLLSSEVHLLTWGNWEACTGCCRSKFIFSNAFKYSRILWKSFCNNQGADFLWNDKFRHAAVQ